ncbi:primosomal protein N' [Calditrichota bacterium LG25]
MKDIFVEVVFNLPINQTFSYRVPQELSRVQPGMRVLVPFGNQFLTGVVVMKRDRPGFPNPKDVVDVLDELPLITEKMMQLTRWVSEYYLSSWGQALFLALPRGIEEAVKEKVFLLKDLPDDTLTQRQRELFLVIAENPGNTKAYYRKKFGYSSFYNLLNILKKKGFVYFEQEYIEAQARELFRQFVHINEDYPQLKEKFPDFLKYLKRRPEIDAYLMKRLGQDIMKSKFLEETRMSPPTLAKMCRYGLCQQITKKVERRIHFEDVEEPKIVKLTDEQTTAIKAVEPNIEKESFATFLIHGVTGSGKTQVYIEVLKKVLARGKTAIVLIPEIALTPQTVRRFKKVVGDEIAIFHSKMSLGERLDYWHACYEGRIKCVVGPRSALFAPLDNLGLIVVDEEHEHTYKQTEINPHYNARDVAIYWARMNNAVVLLGSATPSLESYYNAIKKKYALIEMKKRIDDVQMPAVEIIDMRRAKKVGRGELRLFSQLLIDKINERLSKKEQVILLQNRRGFSAFEQCSECGFIPICPNCDISLTYHAHGEKLQCHLCGYTIPAYQFCPNCGGKQIVYKGTGTQRIEKALQEVIPHARVLRMDRDTTRGKRSHETILQAFAEGRADILLGTQMIAKGLDFGRVTLVGVISADVGLSIPDFRAPERIFQLLTQVAGRAGRRQKVGEVMVQTYSYSHYAIQFARTHDYAGFFKEELNHRKNFRYPPFVRLIQILVLHKDFMETVNKTREIAHKLKAPLAKYAQVLGPAPGIIQRMNNLHRWVVTLKLNPQTDPTGKITKSIILQKLGSALEKKKKNQQILVDVDPITLN